MLTSSYYAGKRYLKYLVHFPLTSVQIMVHQSVIILKETQLTTKCLNTTGVNSGSKMSIYSENQYSHQLVLKYQRHSKKHSQEHESLITSVYLSFVVCHFETNFPGRCYNSFPSEVVKCKTNLPLGPNKSDV